MALFVKSVGQYGKHAAAKNAGFDNYRDYVHRDKNRFDYTPDDCFRFHEAVETAVKTAVQSVRKGACC